MVSLLLNVIVWIVGFVCGGWFMIKDKKYVSSDSWVKASEVTKLHEKIEQMKNCHNCVNGKFQHPSCNDCDFFPSCKHGGYKGKKMFYKDYWSLK